MARARAVANDFANLLTETELQQTIGFIQNLKKIYRKISAVILSGSEAHEDLQLIKRESGSVEQVVEETTRSGNDHVRSLTKVDALLGQWETLTRKCKHMNERKGKKRFEFNYLPK